MNKLHFAAMILAVSVITFRNQMSDGLLSMFVAIVVSLVVVGMFQMFRGKDRSSKLKE
jgi:hypothetical protein